MAPKRTLESGRLQQIVVDADLGKPARGYTEAERTFRAAIEGEIRAIKAAGGVVDFGGREWELAGFDIDFPEGWRTSQR